MSEESPLVLVVEDESDLADLYAAWLDDDYRVRTAYGGHEALEEMSDAVDVVLLDRRMPGLSGDEVLETIRERSIDARVAMVTAVEPDFDIVAMGFDDYLVKPVSRESLLETVDGLLLREDYDEGVRELFSLTSKRALLEAEKSEAELDNSEEYADLTARIEELESDLDRTLSEVGSHDEFESAFRDLETDDGGFDV
ncbi:MAG: HalX domain-containing protein [Halolamina sp.]